jgi:serine/threonine-protein phosphatase 2A regulatory subunit B'
MVYNAMKLFMEINPQLFDDCSHEYTEQQNSAPAREALRERKWSAITDQANKRKTDDASGSPPTSTKIEPMPRLNEADTAEDNQKRLDSLKLQDGSSDKRRPPHERQNSVGSSRSQR